MHSCIVLSCLHLQSARPMTSPLTFGSRLCALRYWQVANVRGHTCNVAAAVLAIQNTKYSKVCPSIPAHKTSFWWTLATGIALHTVSFETGRDSSVGIATHYGLDSLGLESRWRREFPRTSRPALRAHPASCTVDTGSFPEVKRPGLTLTTHPI